MSRAGAFLRCAALVVAMTTAVFPLPADPAADPGGPATYAEILCSVVLNRVAVGNALVLRDDAGVFYAQAADLADWHVQSAGRRSIVHDGTTYVALEGFKADYDESNSTLRLSVSGKVFGTNTIDLRAVDPDAKPNPKPEAGGYLNYELQENNGTNGTGLTGSFDSAFSSRNGDVVSNSGVAVPQGSGFTRLDTTWERDDVPKLTRLRIGDSVVGGTVLPVAPRFAGVQWGTDFTLDPAFVTVASPVFAGTLPSDGTVSVIVDGRQVYQQQLAAGQFLLQNLPLGQGSGDVTLLVRDSSGQVQRIISPYYSAPVLLKAGLSQFEIDGGILRQDYGVDGFAYGGSMAAAQGRRGVSNTLTLDAGITASPGADTAAFEADWLWRRLGQFSLGLSQRSGIGPGSSGTFTYGYSGKNVSVGAYMTLKTPSYGTTGCLTCVTDTLQQQLSASWSMGRKGSVSLAMGRDVAIGTPELRTATLTYSRRIANGTFSVTATRSQIDPVPAIFFGYSRQLGERSSTSQTVRIDGVNSSRSINVSNAAPPTLVGTAYTMYVNQDASGTLYQASLTRNLPKAILTLDAFKGSTLTQYTADLTGSLVYADHTFGFARSVGAGYGVAELPGLRNVRVYANDVEVGRTDGRGRLVLPSLQPFSRNVISIDGQDVPMSANFKSTAVNVSPFRNSPSFARFILESNGGLSLTLVDPEGAFVPPGSQISIPGTKRAWTVAFDGQAYLEGMSAGRTSFVVRTGADTSCAFDLDVPANLSSMPDLGKVVCR